MHIEITRPEVEALLRQRLLAGGFESTEEVIFQALRAFTPSSPRQGPRRNLVEVCAMVHGLADDLDLTRDQSDARPVNFG